MLREKIEQMVKDAVLAGQAVVRVLDVQFGQDGSIELHTEVKIAAIQEREVTVDEIPSEPVAAKEIFRGHDHKLVRVDKILNKPKRKYTYKKAVADAPVKAVKAAVIDRDALGFDRFSLTRQYDTSDADIRIMKLHLSGWKSAGKLNAEQLAILSDICGAWASKLPQDMRDRCLKLFNEVRKKLGITK